MARRGCVYPRPGRSGFSARVKVQGVYRHRGGFSTRTLANAWIASQLQDEMRAEVLGIEAVRDDKAFDGFLPQWKKSLQGRCSPKTIEGYVMVAERVTARLVEALAAHLPTVPKGQDALFVEPDGSGPLRKDTLWNAFRTARRRARLPTFRFHDFRHMYGTRLAELGASPASIKAALGHKSLAATMRYIDHAPEGASRSMGKFIDQSREFAKAEAERKG